MWIIVSFINVHTLSIYTYIAVCLLFVCLYAINVKKAAESIGSKFCVGPHMIFVKF